LQRITLTFQLVNILPPLAIRHAVDAISNFGAFNDQALDNYSELQSQTARTVTLSILAYFCIQTINSVLSSLQSISQRAVSLDAERRFASALFSHLHQLGPAYHLERHAGELLRILSRGSDATSTIIDSLWFNLFPTLFEACVVATVFCKFGIPSIAVSTIVAVVFYLVYTLKVTNTRMTQRRHVLQRSDDVGRIETETLVNYETVVMFGREQKEVEEYDVVRQEYTQERVNMLGLFAWLQLGQQTIRLGGTCIGLWLAGRATVFSTGGNGDSSDTLSPGSFVVVQLYIQQLFTPLSYLGFTYRQITEAFTDLEKAVKCLKCVPSVKDSDDAVDWDVALKKRQKPPAAESSGDIKFDNVSFRYKIKASRKNLGGQAEEQGASNSRTGRKGFEKRGLWGNRGRNVYSGNGGVGFWLNDARKNSSNAANDDNDTEHVQMGGIQNVTFHILAGKTAALVGPSGSGKTTVVRLILRMYDPDNGAVMVDDINVKSLSQLSLRNNIGVVAQDTVLFHASLRDNVSNFAMTTSIYAPLFLLKLVVCLSMK
jgi:ABC-type transport system involved in Fe-S cluster assembly fused permease/ATPase subunit